MQSHVADSESCLSVTRWASEELSDMTFSLRFKPTSAGFYLFEVRNDDSFDGSDLSFDDDEYKSDISSLTLDDSLSSLSSFEDIHSCPDSCVFHLSLCEIQTERSCKHCHSVLSADTQVLRNPDSVSTVPLPVSAAYDSVLILRLRRRFT